VTEPLAQSIGATRAFGHVVAVSDVDLQVAPGEVVGLLGANGAGKTTLIRMLLGLLPPSSGEVRLFGEPPSIATRRRLGYVPQGLGLYDDLTPRENMSFAAAAFGGADAEQGAPGEHRPRPPGLAKRAAPGGHRPRPSGPAGRGAPGGHRPRPPGPAQLPPELEPMSKITVGRLPLGVQRRIAFAQALAHRPDLLVLDEPTSGVDPLAAARLWETIADAAAAGAGVLVTTHHMGEAEECERLVVMAEGLVVAEGDVAAIVGSALVTVAETPDWSGAFEAIERAGSAAALVGRTLRVPGASPEEVKRMLAAVPARVYEAPATLEERFLQLTLPAARAGQEH
jgi:ABC-type multidrug transport system ATPase subunit